MNETDADTILMSDADTIDLPALPAPGQRPPDGYPDPGAPAGPGPEKAAARLGRAARHLPLLAVLMLQATMTLRLRNTAFEDEALYLYAGREEIAHLLHGAALQGSYAAYFSGAPVLYPVLAAALNGIGGLALARALSLIEMLAVTAMLYAITRRLFGGRAAPGDPVARSDPAALGAAAIFAVSAPALFLGHLATHDATCLFLLAAATTIAVRTAVSARPWFLLVAPLAALAVAVKYAAAMFVPGICLLTLAAGWPGLRWRAIWRPTWLCAMMSGLLQVGLHLGGVAYLTAITGTTTDRAPGVTPVSVIAKESVTWGGIVTVLAIGGAVSHALSARAGGWRQRALLGALLCGLLVLAPLYQMHLHTDVSLQKHVGFGLFFAAPLAGLGVARLIGDHIRRPHFGVAVWSLAVALGLGQSYRLYQEWPDSGRFVAAFSRYLGPGKDYLVEVPEVPIYYLADRPDAQPRQFWSTFDITYHTRRGQFLKGPAGYTAAIRDGAFDTIAISGTVTPDADATIGRAIAASRRYRLAASVRLVDGWGPLTYRIWVKR